MRVRGLGLGVYSVRLRVESLGFGDLSFFNLTRQKSQNLDAALR